MYHNDSPKSHRAQRVRVRGLFANTIWHCDCSPRLPAEKFQVKNGGKNHGRWFYTCQKPQLKRCDFFLWADDAKIREERAVLSGKGTESGVDASTTAEGTRLRSLMQETPKTPKKQIKIGQPITPVSNAKSIPNNKPPSPTRHEESFDFSSGAEEDLVELADILEAGGYVSEDESPRKMVKMEQYSSPSKRTHAQMTAPAHSEIKRSGTLFIDSDDVFTTPSTSVNDALGLLSPGPTPAHVSSLQNDGSEEPGPLALEALSILSPVRNTLSSLHPHCEQKLIVFLNKHEFRAQGIAKGRDIARVAIQTKETRIADLQQRIAQLEAEREMNKTVIQHLKSDIATSPKKGRRHGDG